MSFTSFDGPMLQSLFAAQCLEWGETMDLKRGGSTVATINVVCDHPSNVYLEQNFFDPDEIVGLEQPLVAVYIDGTGGGTGYVPAINDAFERDGTAYIIQKVGVWRITNLVIAYLAMGAEGG
jgi:hypothetical protein